MNKKFKNGDRVIWGQSMRGFHERTCSTPATFVEYRGSGSARIKLSDGSARTVRLKSIMWSPMKALEYQTREEKNDF